MRFFNDDYQIYGKYCDIIKKYSADHGGEKSPDSVDWKLGNGEDKPQAVKIFNAGIDCLYAAAALALQKRIKISEEEKLDKSKKMNILASAWKNRYTDFLYLYRLMILVDPDLNLDKDQRVKRAFTDVQDGEAEYAMKLFLQYAYAGLLKLDEMLSSVKSYSDLCDFACRLCNDFEGDGEED